MGLSGLVVAGCTAETALDGGLVGPDPSGTAETALADQIQGTYKGTYQNPDGAINNYEILVTKINDTSVEISPSDPGGISRTFTADLSLEVSGSVESIVLKAASDILATNGTFAVLGEIERLSYAYHLGGDSAGNVEVFSGTKQ